MRDRTVCSRGGYILVLIAVVGAVVRVVVAAVDGDCGGGIVVGMEYVCMYVRSYHLPLRPSCPR